MRTMSKWTDYNDQEQHPSWNKENKVGEVLEGLLVNKRIGVGADNLNFYIIEQKGDKKVSVLGRKLLDDFLKEMPLGTEVRIEYLGLQEPKGAGRAYHGYKCQYDKDTVAKEAQTDKDKETKEIEDLLDGM